MGIESKFDVREISRKVRDMDFDEAAKFLNSLPHNVQTEYTIFVLKQFGNALAEQDRKCRKRYGESLSEHYDLEHPA